VQWARRIERHPPSAGSAPERTGAEPAERVAPGLAAFFHGVTEDGSHAVLDLGTGASASLGVYSRLARRVRFADVLTAAASASGWAEVLESLPALPDRPYDLVIAWDVLDQLPGQDRRGLMERLVEITAPDARMYLLSASPDVTPIGLLRYELMDLDRMRYETTGEPRPTYARLMPAELQRLLSPFQLLRGFSTQLGLREYVAERSR
jgi:hypothetical protein